jgi:hypothetical protein
VDEEEYTDFDGRDSSHSSQKRKSQSLPFHLAKEWEKQKKKVS